MIGVEIFIMKFDDEDYWISKGSNERRHYENLIKRIEFISDYKKIDYNEWKYSHYLTRIENFYCLCGHFIKELFCIKNKSEKCVVGSCCIKKFYKNNPEEIEKLLLDCRKTFDCKTCYKRISKTQINHGKCIKCNKDIDCKYKKCYKCYNAWELRQCWEYR